MADTIPDPLRGDPLSPEVGRVADVACLLRAATAEPESDAPAAGQTALLIELARLHGLSEAAERSNHGLPPAPPPSTEETSWP